MPNPYTAEQYAAAQQAQIDSLLSLTQTAFAGMEQLAALNLSAARSLIEGSADSARALCGASDLQQLIALQGKLAQPTCDHLVAWARSAYAISSATRDELGKTLEASCNETSQSLNASLDELLKQAPAGSAPLVGALKSALGAAGTACANLNKASRQFNDYADASFAAAATKTSAKGKKA